jgi:glycosyltransferase involved in cell wall biosynthesis
LLFVAVGGVPVGSPTDYRAAYERLAGELGIARQFRFAGFREDVRTAVADFDVLVLPSFEEPFGRSIIEAMALGTAVVASSVGGIPEIIADGHNGLLVPPGDPEKLAHVVAQLIDNPERRSALAAGASRDVHERFDVAKLSREIQTLLSGAVAA